MILQKITSPSRQLDKYRVFAPQVVEEIREISRSLQGLKVVHLNATAVGGGVAEMLRSEVSLQQDIGLDSSWFVIPSNKDFFKVTKKIHNLLQGQPGRLESREEETYLQVNRSIAGFLSNFRPQPDILLVHDPQPAPAVSFLGLNKPEFVLWRCHIDTTSPNKEMWEFLSPFLNFYDHYIFTLSEYIQEGIFSPDDLSIITPVIDPLSPKNMLMGKKEAKDYIGKLGIDTSKPLVTQVSRLDLWKDPLGVIDAYRLAKLKYSDLQLALVAQSANDDPEGEKLRAEVENYINGEKGIFLMVNLPENDRVVNAFQTASDIILQKSIREGFSLTVTEAMWKGVVVIGGNVGGIKAQIQDGVNGFLVNSIEETAERIIHVLDHLHIRENIGKYAHESVRSKFLLPHATLKFLKLFEKMLKRKQASPGIYSSEHPITEALIGF
ncbi:MAG: glycosyltransferase [Candidatus Daviesbacteria bacterium]|nr:glycosyltransferase [Candidatus Daviesbacteria bacterium]